MKTKTTIKSVSLSASLLSVHFTPADWKSLGDLKAPRPFKGFTKPQELPGDPVINVTVEIWS